MSLKPHGQVPGFWPYVHAITLAFTLMGLFLAPSTEIGMPASWPAVLTRPIRQSMGQGNWVLLWSLISPILSLLMAWNIITLHRAARQPNCRPTALRIIASAITLLLALHGLLLVPVIIETGPSTSWAAITMRGINDTFGRKPSLVMWSLVALGLWAPMVLAVWKLHREAALPSLR